MTHYLTLKFSVRKVFYPAANTAVAMRLMDGKQMIMTQQQIIASMLITNIIVLKKILFGNIHASLDRNLLNNH